MKSILNTAVGLFVFSGVAFADTATLKDASSQSSNNPAVKFGIITLLSTSGNIYIGPMVTSKNFEAGVMGSAKIIDTNKDTRTFSPGAFAGVKYKFADNMGISFGMEYIETFGEKNNVDIDINYAVGPYVSFKYIVCYNLSLSLTVAPYLYQHERLENGDTTNTHYIFNNGSVGLTYFF